MYLRVVCTPVTCQNNCSFCCVSGTGSRPCNCPNEFRRYGSRCLRVLEPVKTWVEAIKKCYDLGAHLAVPRSQAENDKVALAAAELQMEPRYMVWLGIETKIGSASRWVGTTDGCGDIEDHFWAYGQPDNHTWPEPYVAYSPPGSVYSSGWHTMPDNSRPHRPLCQLDNCYRPDCPQ